jgi:hypothetical protein
LAQDATCPFAAPVEHSSLLLALDQHRGWIPNLDHIIQFVSTEPSCHRDEIKKRKDCMYGRWETDKKEEDRQLAQLEIQDNEGSNTERSLSS